MAAGTRPEARGRERRKCLILLHSLWIGRVLGAFISLWADVYTSNNKRAALRGVNTSDIPVSVQAKTTKAEKKRGSEERENGGRLISDSREGGN